MCQANDMNLSLNSDTFAILKEQFDGVLERTVGNMQMKGAEEATITLKLAISLSKENRNTADGMIEATVPRFKHDISSVMQVKDKVSGQLVGDYELVWDEDEEKYVMRKISNGQMNMFDDDEPVGRFVDAEIVSTEAPQLTEGTKELPAPEDPEEESLDTSTPLGWLAQFEEEKMHVTEAMGNYTVRTEDNKVVFSSATDPSSPFYCPAEKLRPHVGHELICAGIRSNKLLAIAIRCTECAETIAYFLADGVTEKDIGEAMNAAAGSNEADIDDGSYEYDAPEK